MNLQELLEVLYQIKNSRPASKRPSPEASTELKSVYRQIQWLLVDFPNLGSLTENARDILGPLFDHFGTESDTTEGRVRKMIELVISNSGDEDFWRRLFTPEGTMHARLGLREGERRLGSLQNTTIHKFAGLLVSVLEVRSHEISEGEPVTIVVHLPIPNHTPYGTVTMSGDVTNWHVAFTQARTRKYPTPSTSIQFVGSPPQRIRLEEVTIRKYALSTEDAILEVCRLAIWYLYGYYSDPENVGMFVESVLFGEWNRVKEGKDGTARVRATLGDIDVRFEALEDDLDHIRRREAREITEFDQAEYEFARSSGLRYLYWLADLPPRCRCEGAIPALISKWLETPERSGIDPETDPSDFFELGNSASGSGWTQVVTTAPKNSVVEQLRGRSAGVPGR